MELIHNGRGVFDRINYYVVNSYLHQTLQQNPPETPVTQNSSISCIQSITTEERSDEVVKPEL